MILNQKNLDIYEKTKQELIQARKDKLNLFLGKTVRVYDSRHDMVAILRYDKDSEKFFVNLIAEDGSYFGSALMSFYPTEVETIFDNVIRLCEI